MMSEKGEAQQTTREVNLLELTAAQQDRLPKLYPSLPLTAPDKDLLANSLPPSSADNGTPLTTSSDLDRPRPISDLPSLNLPPPPPIASYIDLSSLPPITSSEPILSQLQIEREPFRKNRPRQLPLPPEINSGPVRQLPVPPDLQVEPFRKNRSRTSQLPLAIDLQAYRPLGVNSPFSQLPQVEPSVMSPQQFLDFSGTVQSGRSAFEGLPVASKALRVVGPLPEKIPQRAIDELRRRVAQNRASNLERTVAAGISMGSAEIVVGMAPKPEAAGSTAMRQNIPQQAIDELRRRVAQKRQELAQRSSGTQVAVAPSSIPPEVPRQSETAIAVPRKIPQQAIDELRRRVAQKRAELEASKDSDFSGMVDQAAISQTVASPLSTTVESSPETVAAKPMVSAPETTPTATVTKIPARAIATLRQLQQQFAYNPVGTTPAEALASI